MCGLAPGEVELRVSDRFVGYADLYSGSTVCRTCARLFEDRKLRSSNWVLAGGEFRVVGGEGILEVLRDVPEGGLVYVKSSGRKYGFLRCMRVRSTKTLAAVCGEDEGPFLVPRERLAWILDTAERAYRLFKRKSTLLGGCAPGEWIYADVCRSIDELMGDPVWRIVVRAL